MLSCADSSKVTTPVLNELKERILRLNKQLTSLDVKFTSVVNSLIGIAPLSSTMNAKDAEKSVEPRCFIVVMHDHIECMEGITENINTTLDRL